MGHQIVRHTDIIRAPLLCMDSMMKSTELPFFDPDPIPEKYLRKPALFDDGFFLVRLFGAFIAVGAAMYQVLTLMLGVY